MERQIEQARQYFNAFCLKQIEAISELLVNDVILIDPNLKQVTGKKAVLKATADVLSGCKEIKQVSCEFIPDLKDNRVLCIFRFYYDENLVNVVDVITFSGDKILKIEAFLGC
jgi:hypothetical protein